MIRVFLFLAIAIVLGACSAPNNDAPPVVTVPEHIEFEDRMAIRARLTRIRSEARDEAEQVHDRFASRDEAIAFEELVTRLEQEKRDALKEEYRLNEAQLDAIVEEYLQNQGVRIDE